MAEYTTKPENMSDEQWAEYQKNNAYVKEGLNPMDRAIPGAGTNTEWNRGTNPYAEGTRYYDLWESNPYRTASSKRTFWDDVANLLGFRSSWDVADEQRIQAGKEYDAQIAQLKTEDEYNSPEQQAERMRAAGMNPDLLGTEGVSEAGEFAQEQTSPDYSGKEQVSKATNFIGSLVQVVMAGIGMTREVAATLGIFEEVKTKTLTNAGKLEELADKLVLDYAPERAGQYEKWEDFQSHVLGYADLFAKNNKFNKKQTAQFTNAVLGRMEAWKDKFYNRDTERMKARKEYGITRSGKYTPLVDDDREILRIVGTLGREISSAELHELQTRNRRAQNEAQKELVKSGMKEGLAENAENDMKIGKGKLVEESRRAVNNALMLLKPYMDDGNLLALTVGSALPALQLKYLQ